MKLLTSGNKEGKEEENGRGNGVRITGFSQHLNEVDRFPAVHYVWKQFKVDWHLQVKSESIKLLGKLSGAHL